MRSELTWNARGTLHLLCLSSAMLVLLPKAVPTVAEVVTSSSTYARSSHLSCHPHLYLRKSGSFISTTLRFFLLGRQMRDRFNPIAATLLASAVKRVTMLTKVRPSPNTLHSILEGAGGDVRNAIMTLEFTCAHPKSRKQPGKST
jgi:hypothetical protein